ncbi:MAG: site-specific integrase [Desulfobulbus sp.]|uniref:tyrosine-type recombinase/integrase n=1 Tax=Desulfobulbus sp. TaxID=895 RepID=UPI00284B0917|nr:site-specific integrase [Desulfobulbus sp.]MDR2549076.1 site-specific integrase [Desulfobulbus sp.]
MVKIQTLQDAWDLYEMAILASSKKRSQVTETGRWNHYIFPELGHKLIKNITSFDYLMLRRKLEKQNLSPQSVHHCLSLLRRVLLKSTEWGICNDSIPSFKGIMPKFDNKRQRYLTKEELDNLLYTLKIIDETNNWHDITAFAVNTGLRRGEIFNLKSIDVNLTDKFASVVDTKSGKNRIVPLNDFAIDIISKKIIPKKTNRKLFENKSPKIFINAVKRSGLNNGITDLRQKVVFHTLRHTFASWLVQDGIPIALVGQLLGHSNISMTMRYAHLAPSQAQHAVGLIADRLAA